jgi:hypothetical protein
VLVIGRWPSQPWIARVSWYSGRRAKLHDRLRRKNIEDEFGWWMLALQPISVWRVLLSTHGAAWAEFVPAPSYAQPCRRSMPFDLEATITIALSTGEALTFDHIVRRVTESLRTDIRLSLNELVVKGQIRRRVGGRNYPWRYQAALAPSL